MIMDISSNLSLFSLGPRVCLGATLAKMELFLFVTSLLQRIRFSWPPGVKEPDMNGIVSLIRSPEPFNIICHSRGSKQGSISTLSNIYTSFTSCFNRTQWQ